LTLSTLADEWGLHAGHVSNRAKAPLRLPTRERRQLPRDNQMTFYGRELIEAVNNELGRRTN